MKCVLYYNHILSYWKKVRLGEYGPLVLSHLTSSLREFDAYKCFFHASYASHWRTSRRFYCHAEKDQYRVQSCRHFPPHPNVFMEPTFFVFFYILFCFFLIINLLLFFYYHHFQFLINLMLKPSTCCNLIQFDRTAAI